MVVSRALLRLAVGGPVLAIASNLFLGRRVQPEIANVSENELQTRLLALLPGADHLLLLLSAELELQPTFMSLPKNEEGKLGHAASGYALHRFLAQRHGWRISGLEPSGGQWNEVSPTGVVANMMPSYVQAVFEQDLGRDGFGLNELTVLAASMELYVGTQVSDLLERSYAELNIPLDGVMSIDSLGKVLGVYFKLLIAGGNDTGLVRSAQSTRNQAKADDNWQNLEVFLADAQWDAMYTQRSRVNPFIVKDLRYPDVLNLVRQVNERFVGYQDLECHQLKSVLMERDSGANGRVRLQDFYSARIGSLFNLDESPEYLRHVGALDESDPVDPRVIIPNYLYSKSNCVVSSTYYDLCCIDECNSLRLILESGVQAPKARPQFVAALVAATPSSSVPAPRNLSESLLQRLNTVAERHDGWVPMHGRLYAQWLHHAYPLECPYPHLSGTTGSMGASQWERSTGAPPSLSPAAVEARAAPTPANCTGTSSGPCDGTQEDEWDFYEGDPVQIPWSDEEEQLLAPTFAHAAREPNEGYLDIGTILRALAMFIVLASGARSMIRLAGSMSSATNVLVDKKDGKAMP